MANCSRTVQDQGDQTRNGRKEKQRWNYNGILEISVDDLRLTWPERELVRQLGNRLYGQRDWSQGKEAHHG